MSENTQTLELEEAAKRAATWLQDWAYDLFDTSDAYFAAAKTCEFAGRRMKPEMAVLYGRAFRERAEAVEGCIAGVKEAVLKGARP